MLPASPFNPVVRLSSTASPDTKALSPLELHREKSRDLLNQFFIAVSVNDVETIKKIYKKIGAELSTVGHLLHWDRDKAIDCSLNIDPQVEAESLEHLKDTAYAPMARYLILWRRHDKPLDDPLSRWQILRILDEAEKTGASPDCISLIRDRCPPLQLDPGIMYYKGKSLGHLNFILWCILNSGENNKDKYGKAIRGIYQSNENEIISTAYLLGSDKVNAELYAKQSKPEIGTHHLEHLKNTAYVPMMQYFNLAQHELKIRPNDYSVFIDVVTMPQKRPEMRSILLLAETHGANLDYVSTCRYMLDYLPGSR